MRRTSANVTSAPTANAAAGHHHANRLGRAVEAVIAGAVSIGNSDGPEVRQERRDGKDLPEMANTTG